LAEAVKARIISGGFMPNACARKLDNVPSQPKQPAAIAHEFRHESHPGREIPSGNMPGLLNQVDEILIGSANSANMRETLTQ
jgi:hypothetical protein